MIEESMLDVMFRLPEEGKHGKYLLTEEVARGQADFFSRQARRKESA